MYNFQSVQLLPGNKQAIVCLGEGMFKSPVHCNVKTGKASRLRNFIEKMRLLLSSFLFYILSPIFPALWGLSKLQYGVKRRGAQQEEPG